MNILILSWRGVGHPSAGGAEISTHEHAKGWVKSGHNVTLFTSTYSGAKDQETIDGVEIKRRGTQVFGVQLEALRYLSENKIQFDLVIDQFHGIPFFTPLYTKQKKLGFIHEVAKEVWRMNPWPWPLNLVAGIGEYLEPLFFKLFYKKISFMTVSESTKSDLIDWGIPPSNITIVKNGVENPPIQVVLPKNKQKALVFLGALTKDKGIEDCIDAFAKVNLELEGYHFWVIGKGEKKYVDFLIEKAKGLGLEKNIKFFGYLGEQEKYKLLSQAQLLINTSVREGWGLVVIEAASVGTPTAAFDVPGLRDAIIDGKTGLLIKKRDSTNLAAQIIDLLRYQKRYDKMCQDALERSKKFTWEKAVKESLALIEKIAG